MLIIVAVQVRHQCVSHLSSHLGRKKLETRQVITTTVTSVEMNTTVINTFVRLDNSNKKSNGKMTFYKS